MVDVHLHSNKYQLENDQLRVITKDGRSYLIEQSTETIVFNFNGISLCRSINGKTLEANVIRCGEMEGLLGDKGYVICNDRYVPNVKFTDYTLIRTSPKAEHASTMELMETHWPRLVCSDDKFQLTTESKDFTDTLPIANHLIRIPKDEFDDLSQLIMNGNVCALHVKLELNGFIVDTNGKSFFVAIADHPENNADILAKSA